MPRTHTSIVDTIKRVNRIQLHLTEWSTRWWERTRSKINAQSTHMCFIHFNRMYLVPTLFSCGFLPIQSVYYCFFFSFFFFVRSSVCHRSSFEFRFVRAVSTFGVRILFWSEITSRRRSARLAYLRLNYLFFVVCSHLMENWDHQIMSVCDWLTLFVSSAAAAFFRARVSLVCCLSTHHQRARRE